MQSKGSEQSLQKHRHSYRINLPYIGPSEGLLVVPQRTSLLLLCELSRRGMQMRKFCTPMPSISTTCHKWEGDMGSSLHV